MASPINWIVTLAHVHPSTAVLAAAMTEVVSNDTAISVGLVVVLIGAIVALLKQINKNHTTITALTDTTTGLQAEIKALKTGLEAQKSEHQEWMDNHFGPFEKITNRRVFILKSRDPAAPKFREWPKSNGR